MKKGQILEGTIESIDFPNKAKLKMEDRVITIKNALPGQTVRFQVQKLRSGKAQGRLLEVVKPAENECPAPCEHFGACGGCTFLNLPYEEQLALKAGQVKKLLDEVCDSYIFEGIKASPKPFGYRNKMEFSFGDEIKDGPLALGMHKRGSFHDIVTVLGCQIVDGDFTKILQRVLDFFTKRGTSFYHKMSHKGVLRHLLVRKGIKTGEILVALVTTTQETVEMDELAKELLELQLDGSITGILHILNDSLADVVQSDETRLIYGQDYFYEELLGLRFRITPFSFFQTNTLGAEVLYETARSYVGDLMEKGETPDKVLFDLYSGTGTIAQVMARVAKKVVGVEIVEEAVEAAKVNAQLNGLHNCEFLAGDVLKLLDEIEERPDFIILDPPRDGIHPKALNKIIDYGVERMVYISCKPTSLARDLVTLQARGYRLEKACCVDMFSWSANVETVVLLSKGEVDSKKVRVEFSLEDMDMSDFQDSATYTQIKDYVLEHSGLKVSNLYISQIKRKCGIEVGKNYNLPKSEDSRQPQCPPEKEKAIMQAFKHFGIVQGVDM